MEIVWLEMIYVKKLKEVIMIVLLVVIVVIILENGYIYLFEKIDF